jgi:lysophospholipid acyltransferase (LPLAT)-like uncharacterized protein
MSRLGIRLLGHLVALLLRGLGATWRVQKEGPDPLTPGHGPVVAAFWHQNVLIASYLYRDRGFSVPVSRSRDGDRIAALLSALGYRQSPRGTTDRGPRRCSLPHQRIVLHSSNTTQVDPHRGCRAYRM